MSSTATNMRREMEKVAEITVFGLRKLRRSVFMSIDPNERGAIVILKNIGDLEFYKKLRKGNRGHARLGRRIVLRKMLPRRLTARS